MADVAATGLLQGNTIILDAPMPQLDGRRVSVIIATGDEDPRLTADEQAQWWHEWLRRGPQGPIDDEAPEGS